MSLRTFVVGLIATLGFLAWCAAGAPASPITVNKTFTPNIVSLGGSSLVTVTLENNNPTTAATIAAFADDVGTTMAGTAVVDTGAGAASTCQGGVPTITGNVVTMSSGSIPPAPSASVPGSCTITFHVIADKGGNGINTIRAADVQTSLGGPPGDVSQTLEVQSTTALVSASQSVETLLGTTGTLTFTVSNGAAGAALTGAGFAVNATSAQAFTVTSAVSSCGGTTTIPATGTSGSIALRGAAIPANGSCTITIGATSATAATINFTAPAGTVNDAQGATNSGAASTQMYFVAGQPNVTKTFAPAAVLPNGTSQLTVEITNVLTTHALTAGQIVDPLPAGMTLDAAAPLFTNCGAPATAGAGTATITISGMTIPARSTCTIRVTVRLPAAPGTYSNTIPAGNFSSTLVSGAAADATAAMLVTGAGGGIATGQTVTPAAAGPHTPVLVALTFISLAGGAMSAGTFTDALPQTPAPLQAVNDAGHLPSATNCGPAPTLNIVAGATSVSASGLSIPAGGTCTVTFYAQFTTPTPGVDRIDSNVLTAAGTAFTDAANHPVHPALDAAAAVTELPALTLTNFSAGAQGLANVPVTVAASIDDPSATPDSALTATFNLPAGEVRLAPAPNFVFGPGCPAGLSAANVAIAPSRESFAVGVAAIDATCPLTYDVIDEAGAVGTFTPAYSSYTSRLTGGARVAFGPTNAVTFASSNINITGAFTPNQIQAGSTATANITLSAAPIAGFAQTQADGVAFTDVLPPSVSFATSPNVSFSPGCQAAGQPAPTAAIAGATIAFANISLLSVGTTAQSCTVSFSVTSTTLGAPIDRIAAGSVTSAGGLTNSQPVAASLTVAAGVAIQKSFIAPTLQIGSTGYLRFLIINSATPSALTGGAVVDDMPAQLALASTTLGPARPGDPGLCPASISAGSAGSNVFTVGGITVPGTSASAPGQCVIYVSVRASATAGPGAVSNTIGVGGLAIGGYENQTPSTAGTTLAAAPNISIGEQFNASAIAPGGTSLLTITLANTAAGAAPLSSLALGAALPPNVTIAATPNAGTTCGGGSVTAAAAGSTIALTNGVLAANAVCTITVVVTGTATGSWSNTIAAGAVRTAQGATNGSAATGTLNVQNAAGMTVAESFSPAAVVVSGLSTLTITLANAGSGAVALSSISLADALPANLTVAATPNAVTTCSGGTVAASAHGTSVVLSGASLAAGATCTIALAVTATAVGVAVDTIPSGSVSDAQGSTNAAPAAATLTVGNAPTVGIAASFTPAAIVVDGLSTYTMTVLNSSPGAIALSGLAVSNTLPAHVIVAATPNASTTCAGGTATAAAGGMTLLLTGAAVPASGTCTVSVAVSSALPGAYVDAIPPGAVADTQNVSNSTPVQATLTVGDAPNVALAENFSPATITAGASSRYTISLANTAAGAVALSAVTLTDTLPANVTVAAKPGAVTTCAGATVDAAASSSSIALAGATLAAGASCTVTVSVTGTIPALYTDTIPAAALGSTQGATNTVPAAASLTITPATSGLSPPTTILVTKTTTAVTVTAGDRVNYTIVATPSSGAAFGPTTIVDTLPAYERYAPGTARVAGQPQEPTVRGNTLTWTLPRLSAPVALSYATVIAPGAAANSTLTNAVTVSAAAPGGGAPAQGSASASITVVGSTLGTCYPITGRVYLDINGSGRFADPDVGLAAVHIFLDNGESVMTDSTGRYDFPCVHPGMHALRLDAASLPAGTFPYDDRNIDSEKSARRLVHHTYDTTIVEDVNFAIAGSAPATPDPARR